MHIGGCVEHQVVGRIVEQGPNPAEKITENLGQAPQLVI
jgi:hypothetical protein